MIQAESLADLTVWRSQLGLLPVPLFADQRLPQSYVLLNGAQGNFCLDLERHQVSSETRNFAWSSNVDHYIVVVGDFVEVQRWDQRKTAIERYNAKSVQANLAKFHEYLERDVPRRELSIISHGIGIFRKLRAILGKNATGRESLKGFLYLLACASQGVSRGQVSLLDWGLQSEAEQFAWTLNQLDWDALVEELLKGRPLEELTPNLTLLIRHASGQLFQEAHYEAELFSPNQLRLGGILPSPVKITKRSKAIGLHFTPPALARALVEQAFLALEPLHDSIVIFDPACGSGEFLREALRQLKLKKYAGKINIIGWDISNAACDMARFVLAREIKGLSAQVSVDIQMLDSLSTNQVWPKDVDCVLMNPPFQSWEDMDAHLRQTFTGVMGNLSGRRPDLSHAFVWKATSCLRQDGVLGTILPASFLDTISSDKIRARLSEQLSPKLIARLGSHLLFSDTTIDAAFYVAKKDGGAGGPAIAFWADHRSYSNSAGLRALRRIQYFSAQSVFPVLGDGYNIYPSPELGRSHEMWAPRPYRAWMLSQRLRELPRVGNLFDVKQGVRTGHKSAFLIGRSEWAMLPKTERVYFRPAVENESVIKGTLQDSVYIFFPYGDYHIENEALLRRFVRRYYEDYLLPAKSELLRRSKANPERWWELSRCTAWHVKQSPKLVSTAYGEAGSFAWDERGDFVVVQGYGWIPKQTTNANARSKKLNLAYLAILNSALFSQLLSSESRQVAGGQFDLAEQYISKIALPDLTKPQNGDTLIQELASLGVEIHTGKGVDESKLEELVSTAYGVNEVF